LVISIEEIELKKRPKNRPMIGGIYAIGEKGSSGGD
jgi:hypothetical protein